MKVSVLFLLLLSSVVCQQTQGENGLSSTSVDEVRIYLVLLTCFHADDGLLV